MKKSNKKGQTFWNKEYSKGDHLKLSTNPSEDMIKFFRFLEREYGEVFLNKKSKVLDLGCGNGRNLIYTAKTFGSTCVGFDISSEAISQAKKISADLPISYEVKSISAPLEYEENSFDLVLDMMASHFLNNEERAFLRKETYRVLKPGAFLFLKTFLRTGDRHIEKLLRENPGSTPNSYKHPKIGVDEYVFTEEEIADELETVGFEILKITKSHNPSKRRSMSVYAQK